MTLAEKTAAWIKGSCKGAPMHPRIMEFQKLNFFWEELGLNIFDLNQVEIVLPGWTIDMLEIGLARRQAVNEMESQVQAQAPTTMPRTPFAPGQRVMTRTLYKDG